MIVRWSLDDLPAPEPAADEVVLEVELAGICGSDLHGYRGHPGPRVPPGSKPTAGSEWYWWRWMSSD